MTVPKRATLNEGRTTYTGGPPFRVESRMTCLLLDFLLLLQLLELLQEHGIGHVGLFRLGLRFGIYPVILHFFILFPGGKALGFSASGAGNEPHLLLQGQESVVHVRIAIAGLKSQEVLFQGIAGEGLGDLGLGQAPAAPTPRSSRPCG